MSKVGLQVLRKTAFSGRKMGKCLARQVFMYGVMEALRGGSKVYREGKEMEAPVKRKGGILVVSTLKIQIAIKADRCTVRQVFR